MNAFLLSLTKQGKVRFFVRPEHVAWSFSSSRRLWHGLFRILGLRGGGSSALFGAKGCLLCRLPLGRLELQKGDKVNERRQGSARRYKKRRRSREKAHLFDLVAPVLL
jgi:hypothetical protein